MHIYDLPMCRRTLGMDLAENVLQRSQVKLCGTVTFGELGDEECGTAI